MSDIITQRSPINQPTPDTVGQALVHEYVREDRRRVAVGLGMIGAAAAAGCATVCAYTSEINARFAQELPFVPEAQDFVNNVDNALAVTGGVALPLAVATVGAVKVGAHFNSKLRVYDAWSSHEMSDGSGKRLGFRQRVLRRVAAGGIPGVAAAGVALGAFTAGISAEVSEGPSRPIDAIDRLLPGDAMVVQYSQAMPMVESHIQANLARRVQEEAAERGVQSYTFDLSLGTYVHNGQARDNLTIGVETTPDSPIAWSEGRACTDIPVIIDTASGVATGERIMMNGITAEVVGETKDASAMNRIGLVMDERALHACLEQSPDAPSHAVVLDTTPEEAQAILDEANAFGTAPATVITKEHYKENSREFWTANVQPITNVLALASGALTLISMAGVMKERLLRNRREWAAKLASGLSASQLRATELLRSTKDGIVASVVGTGVAFGVTPVANMLESGFKAGMGVREAFVGLGLGVLGTIAGGLSRLVRLKKAINTADHTRI